MGPAAVTEVVLLILVPEADYDIVRESARILARVHYFIDWDSVDEHMAFARDTAVYRPWKRLLRLLRGKRLVIADVLRRVGLSRIRSYKGEKSHVFFFAVGWDSAEAWARFRGSGDFAEAVLGFNGIEGLRGLEICLVGTENVTM
ncbi:hypothetical protein F4803DRAFT_573250 [Xylaria telfairii]|nr:hypothetical protein F4803DRAFT_573250 [Xylaria telfairii]